ncbi:hypothetical protein EFK32_04030 [Lactococcus lactis subsp. lactis]|nr:hypothetical protein [Lactococcus lactis subsp. lactis]
MLIFFSYFWGATASQGATSDAPFKNPVILNLSTALKANFSLGAFTLKTLLCVRDKQALFIINTNYYFTKI